MRACRGDPAAEPAPGPVNGVWHAGCEGAVVQDRTSQAIAPASPRSVPIFMIAVFCAILGGVLVIAVIDMLAPGLPPTAGERAPSWPSR